MVVALLSMDMLIPTFGAWMQDLGFNRIPQLTTVCHSNVPACRPNLVIPQVLPSSRK
jgi:hypothetical protein